MNFHAGQKRHADKDGNMVAQSKFFVFDEDISRRTQIVRQLLARGTYAIPMDELSEARDQCNEDAVFLVHDDGSKISDVATLLDAGESWNPLVAYSESPSPESVIKALEAGAMNYVGHPIDFDNLISETSKAFPSAGKRKREMERVFEARRRVQLLSPREVEVLDCLTSGKSNREIGDFLGISSRTVEIHRANMMLKMKANSAVNAAKIALAAGLGDPDFAT